MGVFRSSERVLLFALFILSWTIHFAHAQESDADGQTRIAPSRVTRARFGVMVTGVFSNSPATRLTTKPRQGGDVMKLNNGDVITHINGEEVRTYPVLRELLAGSRERKLTVMDRDGNTTTLYGKPVRGMLGMNVYVLPSRPLAEDTPKKQTKPLDQEKDDIKQDDIQQNDIKKDDIESWAVVSITNDTEDTIDFKYRFAKSGAWKTKSIKAGGRWYAYKKLKGHHDQIENSPVFQVSFDEDPEFEGPIRWKNLDFSTVSNVDKDEISFDDGTKYSFKLKSGNIKIERSEREL